MSQKISRGLLFWGATLMVIHLTAGCGNILADERAAGRGYPLNRRLEADFILPAHVNADTAALLLQPTEALTNPLALEVSFAEKETGLAPREPLSVTVRPGSGPVRLEVPIAGWPDGEYRTKITGSAAGGPGADRLIRILRKQTIPAPAPPPEPVPVQGITMLFLDDWYLAEREGLSFNLIPAEQIPILEGALEEGRTWQYAQGIRKDPDGALVVSFLTAPSASAYSRRQGLKYYTARSVDGIDWSIEEDRSRAEDSAADGSDNPGSYRFHDPHRDGPPVLGDVFVKWHRAGPATRWGEITIPGGTAWPVWEKSPGEFLLLTDLPLTHMGSDANAYDYDEYETWNSWRRHNDNAGGQWFSKDGRTLFYCQGRLIARHPPFQIPYDNLWRWNRILVVWRTNDGINWTPAFHTVPTEEDPVGWQHYGLDSFSAEGGNLRMGYLRPYNQKTQQIYVDLTYSRDGILWHRFLGQPAFAANGPPGSWNFGGISSRSRYELEKNGMTYHLLARAANKPHFLPTGLKRAQTAPDVIVEHLSGGRDLPSWPFFEEIGEWDGLAQMAEEACVTLGIMRYRKDGWVALAPEAKQGQAVTRVLRAGTGISLNGRTEPGGSITVELLDEAGKPIPGYSGEDGAIFTGDAVRAPLAWRQKTARRLPDDPFRLRITLDRAELFALRWH